MLAHERKGHERTQKGGHLQVKDRGLRRTISASILILDSNLQYCVDCISVSLPTSLRRFVMIVLADGHDIFPHIAAFSHPSQSSAFFSYPLLICISFRARVDRRRTVPQVHMCSSTSVPLHPNQLLGCNLLGTVNLLFKNL